MWWCMVVAVVVCGCGDVCCGCGEIFLVVEWCVWWLSNHLKNQTKIQRAKNSSGCHAYLIP